MTFPVDIDKRLKVILNPAILGEIMDNSMRSTRLLGFLESQGQVFEQADEFHAPVILDDITTFSFYGDFQGLSAQKNENVDVVKAQWKNCEAHDFVSVPQLVKAASPEAAINYMKMITTRLINGIRKDLEKELIQANADDLKPESIKLLTDDTVNYGQLSISTYAKWKPTVVDAASNSTPNKLVLKNLERVIRKSQDDEDSEMSKLFIYTHLDVVSKITDLYQAIWQPVVVNKADGGVARPHYQGIPIYGSSHVPGSGDGAADNVIYLLNPSYLHFTINPQMPTMDEFKMHTSHTVLVRFYKMVGFTCSFRKRQGIIKNINPAL